MANKKVSFSKKPSKVSNVTRITNRNILFLFVILVVMSIACAVGGLVFSVREAPPFFYIPFSLTNSF